MPETQPYDSDELAEMKAEEEAEMDRRHLEQMEHLKQRVLRDFQLLQQRAHELAANARGGPGRVSSLEAKHVAANGLKEYAELLIAEAVRLEAVLADIFPESEKG